MNNTFGKVKVAVLSKITESYTQRNNKEIKNLIKTIKENDDFKELYVLYEDLEKKYFKDKKFAETYVNELSGFLKGKKNKINETCKKLNEQFGLVETKYLSLYDNLDVLLEDDNAFNIESKVMAKLNLVEHLMQEKNVEETSKNFTVNESLLYNVLINNFNESFEEKLNEEEKKELTTILQMSNEEINNKVIELKESLNKKLDELLLESKETDFNNKILKVKDEVRNTVPSKYNYYKLKELSLEF